MSVKFLVETDELEETITFLNRWQDALESGDHDADEAIRTGERAQEMLEEFVTDLKRQLSQ